MEDDDSSDLDLGSQDFLNLDLDLGLGGDDDDDDDEDDEGARGKAGEAEEDEEMAGTTVRLDEETGVNLGDEDEEFTSEDGTSIVPLEDFGDETFLNDEDSFGDGGFDYDAGGFDNDGGDMW